MINGPAFVVEDRLPRMNDRDSIFRCSLLTQFFHRHHHALVSAVVTDCIDFPHFSSSRSEFTTFLCFFLVAVLKKQANKSPENYGKAKRLNYYLSFTISLK